MQSTRAKVLFFCVLLLSLPVIAQAQTNTGPNAGIGFTQLADSLQEAQAYRYRIYVDGASTSVVAPATCSGDAAPYVCRVALPPLTPGLHTLTMTASRNISGQGEAESVPSAPLAIVVVVAPAAPSDLRIVP